jgi:hypothetical protein
MTKSIISIIGRTTLSEMLKAAAANAAKETMRWAGRERPGRMGARLSPELG